MQSTVVCFAIAVLLVSIAVAAPQPIYPEVHFSRLISPNAVFSSGYCLENGISNTGQSAGAQAYQGLQPCYVGAISYAVNVVPPSLNFGYIGSVVDSFADLGLMTDLGAKLGGNGLNSATAYSSITVCPDSNDLCVFSNWTSSGAVVLKKMDPAWYADLLSVTTPASLAPQVGHLYLVRLTDSTVAKSANILDRTEMLVKFILVEKIGSSFQVDWSVFYGDPKYVQMDSQQEAGGSIPPRAKAAGAFSFVLIILSFLLSLSVAAGLIILVVFRKKVFSGYSSVN